MAFASARRLARPMPEQVEVRAGCARGSVSLAPDGCKFRTARLADRLVADMAIPLQLKAGDCGPARAGKKRGSCLEGGGLGLFGNQLAHERNQHDERNTDREAAGAELREKFCVLGIR